MLLGCTVQNQNQKHNSFGLALKYSTQLSANLGVLSMPNKNCYLLFNSLESQGSLCYWYCIASHHTVLYCIVYYDYQSCFGIKYSGLSYFLYTVYKIHLLSQRIYCTLYGSTHSTINGTVKPNFVSIVFLNSGYDKQ